jgi:hypothetical protein
MHSVVLHAYTHTHTHRHTLKDTHAHKHTLAFRWGEVSGRHIDLAIGDVCDYEFFGEKFK